MAVLRAAITVALGALQVVRWSYHFTAKPGRGALVRLLIGPMWKRYMRKGLAASIREAERTAGPGASSVD